MTQDANSAEIFVEGVIGAPRSRVWQAFTDPALLQQWYAPTGWTLDTASTSVELKVGGAYRVSMHKESDPAIATSVLARFFDVIPEERLASHETVFGASGLEPVEMTLTIDLADAPGGTAVSIRQGPFPYGVDSLGRSGWVAALERLQALLASA